MAYGLTTASAARISESSRCRDSGTRLQDIRLMHSDLRGASFKAAWMQMANVAGANATGSDWARADLRWATFPKADLQAATFRGAELQSADFTNATLGGADFYGAQGLDKAVFSRPLRGVPRNLPPLLHAGWLKAATG